MMKSTISVLTLVVAAALFSGCASSKLPAVETTATEEWSHTFRYAASSDFAWMNQVFLSDDGQAIALISPRGFEAIDANGGASRISANRNSWFGIYTETTRGQERLNEQKVNFIYVPHLHAVLEFNYGRNDESIVLIDLAEGQPLWVNEQIRWSMERYQVTTRMIAQSFGVSSVGGQTAANVTSEALFPTIYINDITNIIPELNALLIKSVDGMALLSLDTGETLWKTEGIRGGVAALMYHEGTNSIIFVNDDSGGLQLEGFQFNKQMVRLDASNGEIIWDVRYNGDIRRKVNGFGDWDYRELDIRLVDDYIMLNFLNLEVYSVHTGEEVFRSRTGADRLLDIISPEAQVMNFFAFPVVNGDHVFRVKHGNIRLNGIDVEMEAFNLTTGERIWETGKLSSNNNIVDLMVSDTRVVAGFGEAGSREGLVGLDAATGEKVWQVRLGRNGVTKPLMWFDGNVWAVSGRVVKVVDMENGTVIKEYTVSESIGWLEDITQVDDKLFMLGRNGLSVMRMQDGSLLTETVAGRTNRLFNYGDRIISVDITAINQSPVHVFNRNGMLLSSVAGSRNRNAMLISADGRAVYTLRNGVVRRYRTQ